MRSYIPQGTVNNLFLEWAEEHSPSLYETSLMCRPSRFGHLQIDGKHLLVNNTWVILVIALDIYTMDVPMAVLCYDKNTTSFRFLIESLLKLKYSFRSLTTDLGKGFVKESQYSYQMLHVRFVQSICKDIWTKEPQKDLRRIKNIFSSFEAWHKISFRQKTLPRKERNGKYPLFLAGSYHDIHGDWINVLLSIKNQGECIEVADYFRKPIYISREGVVNLRDGSLLECAGN